MLTLQPTRAAPSTASEGPGGPGLPPVVGWTPPRPPYTSRPIQPAAHAGAVSARGEQAAQRSRGLPEASPPGCSGWSGDPRTEQRLSALQPVRPTVPRHQMTWPRPDLRAQEAGGQVLNPSLTPIARPAAPAGGLCSPRLREGPGSRGVPGCRFLLCFPSGPAEGRRDSFFKVKCQVEQMRNSVP